MIISNLKKLPRAERERLIARIVSDNSYLPEFAERFALLSQFSMIVRTTPVCTDSFCYEPRQLETVAVGYRVTHIDARDRFIAEPCVWKVRKMQPLVGQTLDASPARYSGFFGVIVPRDLILKLKTDAYSYVLGNLRVLKSLSLKVD